MIFLFIYWHSSERLMNEEPVTPLNEEHITHVFKLTNGEFGNVKEFFLTVPLMTPKKSQVRIPQSNKKDYCRFRFNPIRIRIHPTSSEILQNIECEITFQHLGSLEPPVKCMPISMTIQQNELVLESGSCATGPEVTLREKGSWQVCFIVRLKENADKIALLSEPIRIFGSNYQKQLPQIGLNMQKCTHCVNNNTGRGFQSFPTMEGSKELPFLPQHKINVSDISASHESQITLPSIRHLQVPFNEPTQRPILMASQPFQQTSSQLGKRKLAQLAPSTKHPSTSVHNSSLSLEEKRQGLLATISSLQQKLSHSKAQLAEIDRALGYYEPSAILSPSVNTSPHTRKIGLVFGTDYKHLHVSHRLFGAENDVKYVKESLQQHSHEIITLCGSSATKNNLLDSIHTISGQIKRNDTLLIFIAAYGTVVRTSNNNTDANMYEEGFFCHDAFQSQPHDRQPRVDLSNIVTVTYLRRVLNPMLERGIQIFLIIDASFAGGPSMSQSPTLRYIPTLHQLQGERFYPAADFSFIDSQKIVPFTEISAGSTQENNICVISAVNSDKQAVEFRAHNFSGLSSGTSDVQGLFTWAFLRLCKEKNLLFYLYSKNEKHVSTLFCNFMLLENLSYLYFPLIKFRNTTATLRWEGSFPPASPLGIIDRKPGTNFVFVALPSECTSHSGGCLLVHKGQIHEQIVGLVELQVLVKEDRNCSEYEGFIRFESSPGVVRRGQMLSIVRYGAAFLSVPVEIVPNAASSTMTNSINMNLVQSRSPWMRLPTPNTSTPSLYVQFYNDRWQVTYKGSATFELFPHINFGFEKLTELIAYIAKYIRFRFLLCYVSLPFYEDLPKVDFSLIPASEFQTNLSSSIAVNSDEVHYMIRSKETGPLYMSLLWFRSDGNISALRNSEILPPGETIVCRFSNHHIDQEQTTMVSLEQGDKDIEILCLFVSTHQIQVNTLEQSVTNVKDDSPAFLLDLPPLSFVSWRDRGVCSFVCSFTRKSKYYTQRNPSNP